MRDTLIVHVDRISLLAEEKNRLLLEVKEKRKRICAINDQLTEAQNAVREVINAAILES